MRKLICLTAIAAAVMASVPAAHGASVKKCGDVSLGSVTSFVFYEVKAKGLTCQQAKRLLRPPVATSQGVSIKKRYACRPVGQHLRCSKGGKWVSFKMGAHEDEVPAGGWE